MITRKFTKAAINNVTCAAHAFEALNNFTCEIEEQVAVMMNEFDWDECEARDVALRVRGFSSYSEYYEAVYEAEAGIKARYAR